MSEVNKNLGHATAYGYAKSKGYTGTEEEFAELMAAYASVAQDAEASKQNSEAYAVGTRDGADAGSGDPTYHNNSKYYAEQAGSEAIRALRAVTFTINEDEGTLEVTIP